MFNSTLSIYTVLFLFLAIIEYNLLFQFKLKNIVLEIIGAILLYFPAICVFALIHSVTTNIWKNDLGMQILFDNIPNFCLLLLIIKLIIKKRK